MTTESWLSCMIGPEGHCTTCSDEGIVARVVAVYPDQAMATVEINEERRQIAVDLLDEVASGDVVLVHAGFAIARLEEAK